MTSLSDDKNEVTTVISSHKHPIFDSENPNKLKDWWNNECSELDMNELEECATEEQKYIKMLAKESTEVTENKDKTNLKAVSKARKNKMRLKEMKTSKPQVVKFIKD